MLFFRRLIGLLVTLFVVQGCGKFDHDSGLSIYGGRLVNANERVAQYTVALVQDGRIFCSGVLASPTVVVTAAHCKGFVNKRKSLQVGFGVSLAAIETVTATDFVSHPDYNPTLMRSGRTDASAYDIGVILLEEPAPYGFRPINILPDSTRLAVRRPVLVAGFGKTDLPDPDKRGAVVSGKLLQVNMKLKAVESGSKEVWFGLTPGKASCNGDSGGPGVVVDRGVHKLLGVTSRGIDCRSDVIYTDVTTYGEWLSQFGL